MTATQRFIEDAIAGGWKGVKIADDFTDNQTIGLALLDPLAWQAYTRTKYKGVKSPLADISTEQLILTESRRLMHEFVDNLTNGKTIEEALQAIE